MCLGPQGHLLEVCMQCIRDVEVADAKRDIAHRAHRRTQRIEGLT